MAFRVKDVLIVNATIIIGLLILLTFQSISSSFIESEVSAYNKKWRDAIDEMSITNDFLADCKFLVDDRKEFEKIFLEYHSFENEDGTITRIVDSFTIDMESEMKQKWVDVVSLHTNDSSMIPNKEYGFDVGVNRDDAWYVERKSLNEKRFEEFCRENNQNVKEIFKNKRKSISKENLEKIVVDFHQSLEEKQPSPTTTKIVNKVISVLKTIYSSCLKRYRVIFQVNKRHHLFQHLQN